jgi:hypothetical protein
MREYLSSERLIERNNAKREKSVVTSVENGAGMDLEGILKMLRQERDLISEAIVALEKMDPEPPRRRRGRPPLRRTVQELETIETEAASPKS